MSEQRTSGTATVMFTDVEGSTDLTTRLGDDAAAALFSAHDKVVLEQVSAYGGRGVRSTGDGFLVVFDSARAAVSCALAIQRDLSERGHGLRVRIGLNAGEVIEEGDELFGAAINLANRVMDRADGGEVLTTDTVRQLAGTVAGASFRDRGRVTLKGFAERQRLYEVRDADGRPLPRPAPHDRPRRARVLLAVGLLGVAAIVAAIALAVLAGDDPIVVPPNAVAVIDPDGGDVVAAIDVDDNPGPITAGAGGVWVLNLNSATVSRIDPSARRVVETVGFGGSAFDRGKPGGLAGSPTEVWVSAAGCNGSKPGDLIHLYTAGGGGSSVTGGEVPLDGLVPRHPVLSPASGGCGLAAAGTSVWVATNVQEGLIRADYDPRTGREHVAWARAMAAPRAIAVGHGAVWVVDPVRQLVRRIDPAGGRRLASLRAGAEPGAIATGAHTVWVANEGDNSVSRIDPRTNAVTQAIAVGPGPNALAIGAGAVWVSLADAGAVARIDPATNRVTDTIAVGHRPQGVAVAGGLVWVTVRS